MLSPAESAEEVSLTEQTKGGLGQNLEQPWNQFLQVCPDARRLHHSHVDGDGSLLNRPLSSRSTGLRQLQQPRDAVFPIGLLRIGSVEILLRLASDAAFDRRHKLLDRLTERRRALQPLQFTPTGGDNRQPCRKVFIELQGMDAMNQCRVVPHVERNEPHIRSPQIFRQP